MKYFLTTILTLTLAASSQAAVKTKTIEYEYDGTKMKGFLAYDDAAKEKRPGILVVHEWWGLNDYAKKRAEMLVGLGYVAFCPDMYGEGKTTEHPKEAMKFATEVRKNIKTWQGRASAALKVLAEQPQVDAKNLAAIGYCFGGSTSLQLGYVGSNLKAIATFHAALPTPTEEQAKAIKAKVLVCHGADDKFIPEKAISDFKSALGNAKVPLTFESFPKTVHSFTVPEADAKNLPGMAYNAEADRRSWQMMQDLFKEAFKN